MATESTSSAGVRSHNTLTGNILSLILSVKRSQPSPNFLFVSFGSSGSSSCAHSAKVIGSQVVSNSISLA
ncbi:hypothetical protein MCOR14_003870 [Pyricularia oryzae]|nr:hypothetical protein MCOR17_009981 [Pyricularia oryzae]KAI6480999.1 hypothetical protein MCOR13_010996 [Pyricularia oryzae]KAI6639483.1 hypothetical protein MCOR14_003870 [Pyricularia oryzae]